MRRQEYSAVLEQLSKRVGRPLPPPPGAGAVAGAPLVRTPSASAAAFRVPMGAAGASASAAAARASAAAQDVAARLKLNPNLQVGGRVGRWGWERVGGRLGVGGRGRVGGPCVRAPSQAFPIPDPPTHAPHPPTLASLRRLLRRQLLPRVTACPAPCVRPWAARWARCAPSARASCSSETPSSSSETPSSSSSSASRATTDARTPAPLRARARLAPTSLACFPPPPHPPTHTCSQTPSLPLAARSPAALPSFLPAAATVPLLPPCVCTRACDERPAVAGTARSARRSK